ncbi:Clp protease ClpP (plasmid) [Crassaminicella thermophila]|uniref:ATP-dependent Clp protease proteolytic subunit n=1 Tax=Crassaminicella thermophila TaxID=2599308 RepID=A0A5C0SHP9_CRATE|nr:head maturation protease, ClpP-related [Crassaminicella thermophila]QEK13720.1 Clp protease ClpP [Crassaminicella thermophila]
MKIEIKGPIISSSVQWIYDLFEMEATSPKKVKEQLKNAKDNEDVEVEINSGGGSVFAGSEIYTMLKDYGGNVTVKIVGLAASAASVIAMAGNKVMMSPTGQIMIHNASISGVNGDKNTLNHEAGVLESIDSTIAYAYELKTGMTEKELLDMMNKETWLSPKKALDYGFIDEIMFTENNQNSFVASVNCEIIPQQVIDKLRNELLGKGGISNLLNNTEETAEKSTKKSSNELELAKAKLKLKINL